MPPLRRMNRTGQIVIPANIRRGLDLKGGECFEFAVMEETILIRLLRSERAEQMDRGKELEKSDGARALLESLERIKRDPSLDPDRPRDVSSNTKRYLYGDHRGKKI